jgi:hypothetical protein
MSARAPRPAADAAEIEHREEVRVGELVLQAEADHVEVGERQMALERDERKPARAQEGLEVGPGGIDALGRDLRPSVQHVVEDLDAEVRLGDLVHLGEREREAEADRGQVLPDGAALVAEIAARFLDEREQPLVFGMIRPRHGSREV